jgi:hypothetical protein
MNKTVAIVGKNSLNWDMAPFEDPKVDIFGISYWAALGKYPRLDACFEIHRPFIWKLNINMPPGEYIAWLGQPHDFPIYTQKKYKVVPSAVKFPMKEIQAKYLQKLYRGKAQIGQFFTSSVAYMIALALHLGYERIEVYGVEMTAERYQYQRDSVFWWMGLANGLGVEIVVPENSELFIVNHYGDKPDAFILQEEQKIKDAEAREAEKMMAQREFYQSQQGIKYLHDAMQTNYLALKKRDDMEEHGAAIYLQLDNTKGENVTAQEFEHMKEFYGPDLPGCEWALEGQGKIVIRIKR